MIDIDELTKRYGNFVAVDNISLRIVPGEIFSFLGVNGAGKTTTIRMLVGILRPTSGSIRVGGFDIQHQASQAKAIIGYIPDRPYIYMKLTGKEFLYFVAELYSVPRREINPRIEELLSEFGLLDWQNDLVENYSHGMKQRLTTCAALMHRPKVLIIDEPMVGLDPRGARFLKDLLKRYAAAGTTIFLSTHSLNVAEELADRLAIIQGGKIIATGTLSEIKAKSGGFEGGLESLFLQITDEQTNGTINGAS